MHYARPLSALLLGLLLAGHSLASERYEHFKGQPSASLPQALHNLGEYNRNYRRCWPSRHLMNTTCTKSMP